MSIAILTVTTFNRREYLRCLWEQILKQTRLPNYFVLVDGTLNDHEQDQLRDIIKSEFKSDDIKVLYYDTKHIPIAKRVIGNLREFSRLKVLKYDYIVCMDDDDYNFPERIDHTIKMLKKSKKGIAGVDAQLIADYDMGVIFHMTGFGPNHSVNSFLAYTKDYAKTHSYDITKSFGEEPSFTKDFNEPMVQLDPFKTVIQLSHGCNTYNKRRILYSMLAGYKQVGVPLRKSPYDLIHKSAEKYLTYVRSLNQRRGPYPSEFVYFCGSLSIEWDPRDPKLGGSEQAVVHISTTLAEEHGCSVTVFGHFPNFEKLEWKGVTWIHANLFSFMYDYNVLVLWRVSGMVIMNIPNLSVKKLVVDLHDNAPQQHVDIDNAGDKIAHVMVKSRFHEFLLRQQAPKAPASVIPNGIRTEQFDIPAARRPLHLIYASCYTRGLEPILEFTWPILKRLVPGAHLHVAYGMGGGVDEEFRKKMDRLLEQDGIIHHGRLPVDDIAYLKATCGYHLYYTCTTAEIDCISIRESLVAGCTPILSDAFIFKERVGLHLSLGFSQKSYIMLAKKIQEIITGPLINPQELRNNDTVISWKDVSRQWYDLMLK